MKELCLDISHWDGYIDFEAWKQKHNLWGVIIKAGGNETNLGRYQDGWFERHYNDAKAAGIHIGAYYYTVSTDVANAKKDGDHFADLLDGHDFDLPVYMDVEDPRQFNLSARALTDVIKAFCDKVNQRGYYAGLYTGGSAWLNNVYADELRQYANWIAWWRATWPYEAGDIGMWQQGGIRYSDGNIAYGDTGDHNDCDWCVIDYPSIIKGSQSSSSNDKPVQEEEESNGGTAEDIMRVAYGELGYAAYNDPERGSKYGRWMAELTGEDWLAGPSTSIWWCCMFTSWVLYYAGIKMDGFPSYNTDVALNNGARKYAINNKYDVQRGDVIIFNWDWDDATDHIGFATGPHDGYGFPTIEGNVNNAVKEEYRQLGNVAYVLRPPYQSESHSHIEPIKPATPKNNRDGGKLDVDGIGGWNTIIDWQNQLGMPENGWIKGQDKDNKKYYQNMSNVTFEENGDHFICVIQAKVKAQVDSIWGQETSKKIQKWLIEQGYSVKEDGYFDKESVIALQQSLNDKKWI